MLVNRFGCRPVVVSGSIISTFGFVICRFSNSIDTLTLTYGFIGGRAYSRLSTHALHGAKLGHLDTTPWVKKTRHQPLGHNFTKYYPIFKKNFTGGLGSKFTSNSHLNIPPRFKHVATLPCEIWMSEKWHYSEIHIAINDESQGSIAKNLKCDELLLLHIYHSLC